MNENQNEAQESQAEQRRVPPALTEELFREHAGWLRHYVRRLADNRSLPLNLLDPDDVVQEAFVQLLRHDWAEPIRNPGAWLCVVARNQVSKAAQRYRHVIDDDPAAHIEVGTARWSSVHRQASTEEIQVARATVDAIARLDGGQQIATYLSRVQGWPQADIAAFLGCSTSAAGVHVFRGTHAVRALMEIQREEGTYYARADQASLGYFGFGRRALGAFGRGLAAIQAILAVVTVVLLISGVPWWMAVIPVIAPVGAILVIAAVRSLMWLCSVFTGWLDDHQRRERRAQIARHYGIPERKADRKP
jgi:RNA polymerase sigma factor (sigma-70 family)